MKLDNRVLFLCLFTLGMLNGLLLGMDDLNPPISLEDYKQALASNDPQRIIKATQTLWPHGKIGIHIEWLEDDFQVVGEPCNVSVDWTQEEKKARHRLLPYTDSHGNVTMMIGADLLLFKPVAPLDDTKYREALYEYVIKQLLYPAIFGNANISDIFAKIHALSNNFDGIFGNDLRLKTQYILKHVILANRFPAPNNYAAQVSALGLTPVHEVLGIPGGNFMCLLHIKQAVKNLVIHFDERTKERNSLTLAQYKAVLTTGDCKEIVKATQSLWPKNKPGFKLQFNGHNQFYVAGQVAGESQDEYETALLNFVVNKILKPAVQGTISVDTAFAHIDQLAGKYAGSLVKSWDGILDTTRVGSASDTKEVPNIVALSMKLAICSARNIDPASRGLSFEPFEYAGHHRVEDSIPQLVTWIKNGGQSSIASRLFAWPKMAGGFLGAAVIACVGYLLWDHYAGTSKENEEAEIEDENNQEAHDIQSGENV